MCAPCPKLAGFADVAIAPFIADDGKKVYTVVTLIEKEDAGRVRYRAWQDRFRPKATGPGP